MTLLGWIVLIVVSVVVALVAQYAMKSETMPYRWIVSAIGIFVGAAVSSEMLFAGTTPEFEGIAVWPAVIGGLIVGAVVDLIAQYYARQNRGGQGHGAPVH